MNKDKEQGDVVESPKETKKKVVEKDEDVVTISKKDFNEWMSKMEKQSKDIELLYKASDKSRIAKAKGDKGEVLIKQARVSTWDDTGKLVIGWKLLTNRCEVVMGRWVEEQDAAVILEGGETIRVPLLEFYRKTLHKIAGDIISRTTEFDENENKVEMLKIEMPNGKKIIINSTFIN